MNKTSPERVKRGPFCKILSMEEASLFMHVFNEFLLVRKERNSKNFFLLEMNAWDWNLFLKTRMGMCFFLSIFLFFFTIKLTPVSLGRLQLRKERRFRCSFQFYRQQFLPIFAMSFFFHPFLPSVFFSSILAISCFFIHSCHQFFFFQFWPSVFFLSILAISFFFISACHQFLFFQFLPSVFFLSILAISFFFFQFLPSVFFGSVLAIIFFHQFLPSVFFFINSCHQFFSKTFSDSFRDISSDWSGDWFEIERVIAKLSKNFLALNRIHDRISKLSRLVWILLDFWRL